MAINYLSYQFNGHEFWAAAFLMGYFNGPYI